MQAPLPGALLLGFYALALSVFSVTPRKAAALATSRISPVKLRRPVAWPSHFRGGFLLTGISLSILDQYRRWGCLCGSAHRPLFSAS